MSSSDVIVVGGGLVGTAAYAKKNPGKLDYGSGGVGSMGQLNVEMLKAATGIYANHIRTAAARS